jgi:hypothetical protein
LTMRTSILKHPRIKVILYSSPKVNFFIEWDTCIRITIWLVHCRQFLSCSLASFRLSLVAMTILTLQIILVCL